FGPDELVVRVVGHEAAVGLAHVQQHLVGVVKVVGDFVVQAQVKALVRVKPDVDINPRLVDDYVGRGRRQQACHEQACKNYGQGRSTQGVVAPNHWFSPKISVVS